MSDFLPTTQTEARLLGYKELDVIIVSADDYVDHPAFGMAIIGRFLKDLGLQVGIIPRPDWRHDQDWMMLGRPRLFFAVTAGNLDSMVALYTSARKIRSQDAYAEGGVAGKRPYLPTIVYTNKLKQLFKGVPVVIGGIEASLRRLAHYDYYRDKVCPPILLSAKADMLIYGNAERPLRELVNRLCSGQSLASIRDVRGTAIPINMRDRSGLIDVESLPSAEEVTSDPDAFNAMTKTIHQHLNPHTARPLYQAYGTRGVLVNPPAFPLSTEELDAIYDLNFTRKQHPRYNKAIPALATVANSITAHRGCYGGCSFCAIALHQGKDLQMRSIASIQREILSMYQITGKPIVITDIGGPSANMYGNTCRDIEEQKQCKRRSCLYPSICKQLNTSHRVYRELLCEVRQMAEVKKVYINSGIRCDLAVCAENFVEDLARYHVQGKLSVAPEHSDPNVLRYATKPDLSTYDKFGQIFTQASQQAAKTQTLSPYFIVGLPGEDEIAAQNLARYIAMHHIESEQIQEFYPTPMSIASAMYYTQKHPFSGKPVHIEKRQRVRRERKQSAVHSRKAKSK
jgi:uncharacterized radical SAM protein YgiQ